MSNIKKVNLGCGRNVIEEWINIDKSWNIALSKHHFLKLLFYKLRIISRVAYEANWSGKNILRHDIRKKLPFKDKSVNYVYCSHVLEHLTREDAQKVCQDVYKILKPGGVFRVVVPDLKLLTSKYINGDKSFFGDSKEPIADNFINYVWRIKEKRSHTFFENLFIDYHKWMYDFESLSHLLRNSGFEEVSECKYRQGECADLKRIEPLKRREESIYIEAIKSGE